MCAVYKLPSRNLRSSAFSTSSECAAIDQELSSAFSTSPLRETMESSSCASPLPEIAASSSCASPLPQTAASLIRVRWERNGSKCYDGKTQDIPLQRIVLEDQQREVGGSVRVEWREGGRLWNAVVLEKLPQPSALDMALPANRLRATQREVSFALFCVA